MKNIKKISILFFATALLAAACTKDWLAINNDPNQPSTPVLANLLTSAERSVGDALSSGPGASGGINEFLCVYMHQVSTREAMDQYGLTGTSGYLSNPWTNVYAGPLESIYEINTYADKTGNKIYSGIGRILKAYTFSVMTDVWGDIPYSEANRYFDNIYYTKYDKAADIYASLFQLLDTAISNLRDKKAANLNKPGADDVIFGGDTTKWIRTANTLKLKLLTQIRLTRDITADVAALELGKLMKSNNDNFTMPYGATATPDDRNPGYLEYQSTQKSFYTSPWFYEILKGKNPNILTGIVDPRIPYYFYNQLKPGDADKDGNPIEYRDGGFVSIYFGSIGVDRDHAQDKSMTVQGIFPVGGRYDQGDGLTVDLNSGTGAVPFRFITYADKLYMEAELIHAGVLAGNERTKLGAAIDASFSLVDWVVGKSGTTQAVPAIVGAAAYRDTILYAFDNATADKKLEIIMTQKWVASFGNSINQYADYRRTGYPVLFDPNNAAMAPGGFVTPPDGHFPTVPVQCINQYPRSLPWPTNELKANPNAPAQKDPATYKLFWDIH
jgi:hypothetical protein